MGPDLIKRITTLAQWLFESRYPVVFTGAGISTESGLSDFRGPDGIWTRRERGLPITQIDFSSTEPNTGHFSIVELQNLGKLRFLISQNVDNLHLRSGIRPDLLAELHGNITKLRCIQCAFLMDNFDDEIACPLCGGKMISSVVNFGQSLPQKEVADSYFHSGNCDLFIVIGSSLVVYPAADMPGVALKAGARLVIINQCDTPFDTKAHLRFFENIGDVMPVVIEKLKLLME